ncbi:ATP-dependent RNA helicase HrpA [Spiractinospora alimapuensis]|uniref:ATP-dependent RNA helicase HrpA n=1 Tax=Spiractinospora alimapuensis TaxID=2820884 RepID=UPI001F3EAC28|nr:ATP-dependent RNA helicase HrpA [Spiractinospora alimapuensis]QVQ53934.1 ATP-dependent RNA helicase HrpA [Spiractinospora alimapuensis]
MSGSARSAGADTSELRALRERLEGLGLADRRRFGRRIDGVRKIRDQRKLAGVTKTLAAEIDKAQDRVERRRAGVPEVTYPEELPVSAKRDDILAAIRDNQVVIVAGETGSGKTTQLPKMCLELGRGVLGQIGHTQPRRLAARTVAERVAEELGVGLGGAVGYQVRFTERAGGDTNVKLMTDGILLAEIQRDRLLERYDTLIIDEAHERSLNVDFILGYLKRLLPRRPDLKVIITSATIDPERFADHFGGAPIVEVSGRTYPVEVRYRPLTPETADADTDTEEPVEERDQTQAIGDAVEELCREGPGDILVFLSGEREIRDTADALTRRTAQWRAPVEILPLYARLPTEQQQRVFHPGGTRRVVLATNVAETSLTVPGIHYVIDPGTARISRYSHRTKVQRLPIEPVSQASANQRKGRSGRIADGICVRLYSEEDFLQRPEFTDPEILRTNLASVILQMAAARLGEIAEFPFIDPPDRRNITDGMRLLHELGALESGRGDIAHHLTEVGRSLARLPLDPRMARMILAGDAAGVTRQVIVIAAALTIQDPRERPEEQRQRADGYHGRFAVRGSDFLAYLNLWNYLRERQRELSGNQFRKMCRTEFLNYLRVREWQDLVAQLGEITRTLGVDVGEDTEDVEGVSDAVHRALLTGLLSHVGLKEGEKQDYLGARGTKFAIFPGSSQFKRQPRWVMTAELVETTRLWGRGVARIEPEWAESAGAHLVKRNYSEPHWEKRRGAVMAYEKVTLFGIPLVSGRKVTYSAIDPDLCRELFIRHALVEGDWETRHEFFAANRRLLEDVEELEHRARRRDIRVDDEVLFEFYDRRVPADVVSARHFDSWWKTARRSNPTLLTFTTDMLVSEAVEEITEADFPDTWHQGDLSIPLTYSFEPGADADGVTAHVPLRVLNQVTAVGFDWQVPGLREELVTALIRSLPKPIRRNFVPVPDHARAVLRGLTPGDVPLTEVLGRELSGVSGDRIPADAWQWDRVPDHLRITFRVEGDDGENLGEDKDLEVLRRQLKPATREAVSRAAAPGIERTGLQTWDFDTLPRTVRQVRAGQPVEGYPALTVEDSGPAEQGTVAVRVLDTEPEQRVAHRAGVRRLLLRSIVSPVPLVQRHMNNSTKLALAGYPGGAGAALSDALSAATDQLMATNGGPVWNATDFAALRDAVQAGLAETLTTVALDMEKVLATAQKLDKRLRGSTSLTVLQSLTDMRGQLADLVAPGFATNAGAARLSDIVRYLHGIGYRLDKLADNPRRDQTHLARIVELEREYQRLDETAPPETADQRREIRWMVQELRVSFFAQSLGTAYTVSEKRVRAAMAEARG